MNTWIICVLWPNGNRFRNIDSELDWLIFLFFRVILFSFFFNWWSLIYAKLYMTKYGLFEFNNNFCSFVWLLCFLPEFVTCFPFNYFTCTKQWLPICCNTWYKLMHIYFPQSQRNFIEVDCITWTREEAQQTKNPVAQS